MPQEDLSPGIDTLATGIEPIIPGAAEPDSPSPDEPSYPLTPLNDPVSATVAPTNKVTTEPLSATERTLIPSFSSPKDIPEPNPPLAPIPKAPPKDISAELLSRIERLETWVKTNRLS